MPNVNLNDKHVMTKSVKALPLETREKRAHEEYSWHRI